MSQEKDNKEKKERVKYKFGQKELDLDNYIYNLGTNVQSYLNNKNWNDDQKQAFMEAYDQYLTGLKDQLEGNTGRFSTDDFGTIYDNTGALSDKGSQFYYNDKGEKISSDDYNNLKERKQKKYTQFSAFNEVANYFNKVGRAIKVKGDPTSSGKSKFDVSKHGFVADWQSKNGVAGEKIDLKPYLDLDPYDPTTKKRGREKRLAYLSDQLKTYLDNFDYSGYDFEGTPYGSAEGYKAKLQELVDHMKDGQWTNDDMILANQAGIGGSFYDSFFTEDEISGKTEEQRKAEEDAAKKKADQEKQDAFIKDSLAKYKGNNYQWTTENPYSFKLNSDYFTDNGEFDYGKYRESFPVGADLTAFLNKYLANPYDATNMQRAWAGLIGTGQAIKMEDGRYYMPQARNDETQSVLIYDPTRGQLYHTFIGDVKPEWQRITQKYRLTSGQEQEHERYRFKEGGVVQYQLGGGVDMNRILEEGHIEQQKQRAKASGRDLEQQQAGERIAGIPFNTADPSMGNPDAGFSNTDKLRLATIGADIASAITAFIPGVGTGASAALGIGSSLGTFAADWAEDGLDWDDAKNLGINLGMDFLGMIPAGGAASKTAKIAKNLGKWVPRIVAAIGTMNTLQNGEAIIGSFGKLTSNPSKLTVDDWRNISQAIGLVAGVAGAAKRKSRISKQAPKTKQDVVAVEMFDKTTNQKQTYLFNGDDAKAIRTAQKTGDTAAMKKVTEKYEGMKDLEVSTTGNTGWRGFHDKEAKWNEGWRMNPFGEKAGKPRVFDIATDKSGQTFARTGTFQDDITSFRRPGRTAAEVDAEIKKTFDPLNEATRKVKDDLEAESAKLESRRTRVADFQRKLNGDTAETMDAKIKKINEDRQWMADNDIAKKLSDRQKLDAELATAKIDLETAQKKFDAFKRRKKTDTERMDAEAKLAEAKIKVADLEGEISKFNSANTDYDSWKARVDNSTDKKLNDAISRKAEVEKWLKDMKKDQRHIDKYEDKKRQYEEGTIHTDEFKAILDKFGIKSVDDKFNLDRSAYGGRGTVETTLKELLEKNGITTYYKQGGSFDHVRKFKNAGKITNTTSKANWYDHMFQSPEMKQWIDTYGLNNYQKFNELQKSWADNRKNTGYNPGASQVSFDQGVHTRQGLWNGTGTNAAIERAFNEGNITRAGKTGDNAEGGYQDGYFGEQEFLRHGGTRESWAGREKELKAFQDMLAEKGLTYTLDDESGMYLMGELSNTPETAPETTPASKVTPSTNKTTTNNQPIEEAPKQNVLQKMLDNPTLKYGVPRTFLADAANKRVTKMALEGEKPYLQDPFQVHRSVKSDLDAEMQGQSNAAKLSSMASRSLTSDGSLQTATMLEAQAKGQEFINQGKAKSNEAMKESSELAQQQEKENARNRNNVAQQNRLSMMQTDANKNKIKMAYESKKHNIQDTLLQQIEYEARQKQLENKSKQDAFAQADITAAVSGDPNKYGAGLTEEELAVWTKMMAGADYTNLDREKGEDQLYLQARTKVTQAEQRQLGEYYGIQPSKWSGVRKFHEQEIKARNEDEIPGLKDGGKVKVAGIKAKTADAERFQKAILASIERNEKVLDRLSKSMYGYIKASIV